MFLDFEKKNFKNVKNRMYSFTSHLITQHLITGSQYRCRGHQHQTSQKCWHKKLCNWELCV